MRKFLAFCIAIYLTSFLIAKSGTLHEEIEGLLISSYAPVAQPKFTTGIFARFNEQEQRFKNIDQEFAALQANSEKLEKELSRIDASLASTNDFDYTRVVDEAENLIPAETELARFASKKVDVATYEYENGLNYQIDIYDHGKRLSFANTSKKAVFAGL